MNNLIIITFFFLLPSDIPKLNQKVVDYVDSAIGKKIGRGECWDLAAAALEHAGAYLDRSNQKSIYVFGKKLNPKKNQIFPGDIIQIQDLKIEYTKGNTIYTESMSHHTAIIYEVISANHFKIAHQNTSFSGKKVGVSELNMSTIKKGKITFIDLIKDSLLILITSSAYSFYYLVSQNIALLKILENYYSEFFEIKI